MAALDLHSQMLFDDFIENKKAYSILLDAALDKIRKAIKDADLFISLIEGRVKTDSSLEGKLRLKGGKYHAITDITDLVGIRVVAFYTSDVDKIASLLESMFTIDWDNSIDKRKILQVDTFGYLSLHYICRIPKELFFDPEHPDINDIPFEVQMRTVLQHMWATMYHDTGYKSGVEIPIEYLRNLNRLAGMLELADNEFNRTRTEINEYRRKVRALVADGQFDDVPLNGDTFKSYLELGPFDKLNARIAEINQAEIYPADLMPFLPVLKSFQLKTLADLDNFVKKYSEDAYQLGRHSLGKTDLDIVSENIGIINICVAFVFRNGGGVGDLKTLLGIIDNNSSPEYNASRAERLFKAAQILR